MTLRGGPSGPGVLCLLPAPLTPASQAQQPQPSNSWQLLPCPQAGRWPAWPRGPSPPGHLDCTGSLVESGQGQGPSLGSVSPEVDQLSSESWGSLRGLSTRPRLAGTQPQAGVVLPPGTSPQVPALGTHHGLLAPDPSPLGSAVSLLRAQDGLSSNQDSDRRLRRKPGWPGSWLSPGALSSTHPAPSWGQISGPDR